MYKDDLQAITRRAEALDRALEAEKVRSSTLSEQLETERALRLEAERALEALRARLPAGVADSLTASRSFWSPTGRMRALRPAVVCIASVLFGMAVRVARPFAQSGGVHYESLLALILLAGAALGLCLAHRQRNSQVSFQIDNVALWSGFACGWSIVHRGLWSDFWGVAAAALLCAAVVGGLIVSVRNRRRSIERR